MAGKTKRNPWGSGSIRQKTVTKNGKDYVYWEARVTLGYDPATGKQKVKYITGKSQREVAQQLREVTAAVGRGDYVEPSRMPLDQWLDLWYKTYLVSVKQRTREIYEVVIRLHIKPYIGKLRLCDITPAMLQSFINECSTRQRLSPKSIKNVHCVLHESLHEAVMNGFLRSNPAEHCILPKVERKEIHPLTEDEVPMLLKELCGDRVEALIKVALFTGMREGELMGLRWSNIDFRNGIITISKQLQRARDGGAYELQTTKNGRSRSIAPAEFVMTLLREQKAKQNAMKERAGCMWENSGYVFTNEIGEHLTEHIVYRHFKRAATAIGRPDARFHDLRHTYAVMSLNAGDDPKTLQSNLGHATAAFTLDVYGHTTDRMKHASGERMDNYIHSVILS